jgi:biopolymer transport protein ExbD
MKINSPLPRKRGRIEIIPLIDIMFFLLAAFMVVSIAKIRVHSLKVSLPTNVPVAEREPKEDFITVSVNASGQVQIDKELIRDPNVILPKLREYYAKNPDQKFMLSADKETRNGDVIAVLGKIRTAGFQRVAVQLDATKSPSASTENPSMTPVPAPPLPAPVTPTPPTPPASSPTP